MAVAERLLNLKPVADPRPDRALVYEAQRGKADAASVLIERYYPRVYSFVSHLTYGRGSAEDLTQEVFARALKALGRFNGQYQFEHWLLRIAKNLCIDEARRNVRSPQLTDPLELPEMEGIEAPDYVWESVSRDLVAAVVHRALAALPSRQRAILVMREMEAMSYADIAQVVGTNPRGVEATLRRARMRFRAEITQAEATEQALANCRRVLRLVSDRSPAARSGEVAAHLAECAECRRATRASTTPSSSPVSRTAFGFLPLAGLVGRRWILRSRRTGHAMASSVRRGSDRLRNAAGLVGLETGAAMAVPLARMAELTAGVLVATAVTLAPTIPTPVPAATTAALQPTSPIQVTSVTPVSVLFRASSASPLRAVRTSAAAIGPSQPTPSIMGGAGDGTGLLGLLGLGSGQSAATAVDGVATVSNILADQLTQVDQLAGTTVSEVGGAVGPAGTQTTSVTSTVTNLATTAGRTLTHAATGMDGIAPSGSTLPSQPQS